MNTLPKIVVSTTLSSADRANTRLLGMGLVDELRVMVNPVVLGGGARCSGAPRTGCRWSCSRRGPSARATPNLGAPPASPMPWASRGSADHAALAGAWSWLGEIAGQAMDGGLGGMVDDDLAYVAPWGFDPGQVRPPVLFLHGGQDRVAPSSHGGWLASHTRSAELWRPWTTGTSRCSTPAWRPWTGSGSTPTTAEPREP